MVDWNAGMERWNGMVEWNGGMEWWNGTVEWNGGMVSRIHRRLSAMIFLCGCFLPVETQSSLAVAVHWRHGGR